MAWYDRPMPPSSCPTSRWNAAARAWAWPSEVATSASVCARAWMPRDSSSCAWLTGPWTSTCHAHPIRGWAA
jgi:hypothetical protein